MSNRPYWFDPRAWVADPHWTMLSAMPAPNVRMLILSLLDFITFVLMAHIMERVVTLGTARVDSAFLEVMFGMWLGWLAGAHGYSYSAYKAKRNSSWSDQNATEDSAGQLISTTAEMRTPTGGAPQPRQTPLQPPMPVQPQQPVTPVEEPASGSFTAPAMPLKTLVRDD